jgi:hypothetical protein
MKKMTNRMKRLSDKTDKDDPFKKELSNLARKLNTDLDKAKRVNKALSEQLSDLSAQVQASSARGTKRDRQVEPQEDKNGKRRYHANHARAIDEVDEEENEEDQDCWVSNFERRRREH